MVNLEAQPKSAEVNALSRSEFYEVRSAAINKFANMGLSGREISFAVEIETGLKIEPDDVSNLAYRARLRGTVRQLTPEEKADIVKTTANPWKYTYEAIKKDVISILQGIEILQAEGRPLPQNRLDLRKLRVSQNDRATNKKKGGVRTGNGIMFPDGTHIPTFEGHTQSGKQKLIAKERNRRPKSREQVAKLSTVWPKVKILRQRLALSSEIAAITGFTRKQVKRAIDGNRLRPEWNKIPALTPEQVVELKRRSGKAKKPRNPEDRKLPTQDEKNNLAFAKIVLDSGLISEDLRDWRELNSIYAQNKRDLSDSFTKRLRLEVFLKARKMAHDEDRQLLKKYIKIGEAIDAKWFEGSLAEEQKFITQRLSGKNNGRIACNPMSQNGGRMREDERFKQAGIFFKAADVPWGED